MINDLVLDTQFAFLRLPDYLRLRKLSLARPFCEFSIDSQNYEVKVANTSEEVLQVLRLRFEIFYQEFAGRKVRFAILPYDVDHFDLWCDHLIVKDKKSNKVIAAYRLLHSGIKKETYYSESEFELDGLLKLSGEKLELGRACVHKDFRHGTVMGLLWKGLLKYARATNTRYLFGCSSVQRQDFTSFQKILHTLEKKDALLPVSMVVPRSTYAVEKYPKVLAELSSESGESTMGSLMHMYIMAGAKMGVEGAYDKDMDCLDLFTWIDLTELPAAFERRFSC